MKINNLSQAEKLLQSYIPNSSLYSGDNMTLERMWPLLEAVGNPHEKLKIIHIAGTSGKTSTSYYLAALLKSSGKKVGLTVSPHVDSITERIQIDGLPVEEGEFCALLEEFMDLVDDVTPPPSYFELLIAFVYWAFAMLEVDYAVIETGMGGLLDGTNVASREDKVCVITDIGLDHTNILGNTISEIAEQKAGIIHQRNEVFMYEQSAEVMKPFLNRVEEKSANLHTFSFDDLVGKSELVDSPLPLFQHRNWALAFKSVEYVAKRDDFSINSTLNPLSITVPCRMEIKNLEDGSTLVMDGSHNGQKMQSLVSSFQKIYPNQKTDIVLALKKGKEFKEVIDALLPIAGQIIITTFSTAQDLPAVSQNPETIAEYCHEKKIESKVSIDHRKAYESLLDSNSQIKLVTGSFYLLGQIRKSII